MLQEYNLRPEILGESVCLPRTEGAQIGHEQMFGAHSFPPRSEQRVERQTTLGNRRTTSTCSSNERKFDHAT